MAETTLLDLVNRALAYADLASGTALTADQKAVIVNDINDGLIELWDMIVDSHAEMALATETYGVTPGTEDYDLPSDFYKALKVFYLYQGRRYRMERFNLDEIDGLVQPLAFGDVELWYAPKFTRLALDADVMPTVIPQGWENYAALFAAARMLKREESDASAIEAERDRLGLRITTVIEPRDEGKPERVADVYGRWGGMGIQRYADPPVRDLRYRILGSSIYFVEVDQ